MNRDKNDSSLQFVFSAWKIGGCLVQNCCWKKGVSEYITICPNTRRLALSNFFLWAISYFKSCNIQTLSAYIHLPIIKCTAFCWSSTYLFGGYILCQNSQKISSIMKIMTVNGKASTKETFTNQNIILSAMLFMIVNHKMQA